MQKDSDSSTRRFAFTALWRMVTALGAGLALGELGTLLGWNQQNNVWFYMLLLCPFLLAGISWSLTIGLKNQHPFAIVVETSVLAWIGFYLTFVVLFLRIYSVSQFGGPPPPEDPYCSPCFSADLFVIPALVSYFPFGLVFIMLTAFMMSLLAHLVIRLSYWIRHRSGKARM